MDLILWRHAEAFEMREVQEDMDRALTPKGERQAQRVATWLNRQLPSTARVLSSPARRAQQTAAALDRKVRTAPELAPDTTVEAFLHATRWPESREPVLVVGHQPTLGAVASFLLAGDEAYWSVRKGAVWWLSNRDRGGDAAVVLRVVIGPDFV